LRTSTASGIVGTIGRRAAASRRSRPITRRLCYGLRAQTSQGLNRCIHFWLNELRRAGEFEAGWKPMSKTPLTGPTTTTSLRRQPLYSIPSTLWKQYLPVGCDKRGSDVALDSSATRRVRGVFTRPVCHLQNRFGFSRSAFISKLIDRPHPRPDWLLAPLKSRCNLPGRARSIVALRRRAFLVILGAPAQQSGIFLRAEP
jgi:hypothetical protein